MSSFNKLASGMVNSSVNDPRLSGLTAGKSVDTTAFPRMQDPGVVLGPGAARGRKTLGPRLRGGDGCEWH
jgi:hypothetical protein